LGAASAFCPDGVDAFGHGERRRRAQTDSVETPKNCSPSLPALAMGRMACDLPPFRIADRIIALGLRQPVPVARASQRIGSRRRPACGEGWD